MEGSGREGTAWYPARRARQVMELASLGHLAKAVREEYMTGGMGVPVASLSFDEAIARFASMGFHVASRNETNAYLTRKRSRPNVWQLLTPAAIFAGAYVGFGWLHDRRISHFTAQGLVFIVLGSLAGYYFRIKVPEVVRLRATRDGRASVHPVIFPPPRLWRRDTHAG